MKIKICIKCMISVYMYICIYTSTYADKNPENIQFFHSNAIICVTLWLSHSAERTTLTGSARLAVCVDRR